jgi:hypothetical protein
MMAVTHHTTTVEYGFRAHRFAMSRDDKES